MKFVGLLVHYTYHLFVFTPLGLNLKFLGGGAVDLLSNGFWFCFRRNSRDMPEKFSLLLFTSWKLLKQEVTTFLMNCIHPNATIQKFCSPLLSQGQWLPRDKLNWLEERRMFIVAFGTHFWKTFLISCWT